MHLRTVLYTCVLLLTLGMAAQAASVPLVISHQGRLLDDNDVPVSGMRALTFSLYDASTGGMVVWTESHPTVSINEGLFTVLLGSTVPMTAELFSPPTLGTPVERWMQIAVDGQVLSPRMRVASVPYASSSSRVDGDIETSQGELRLHGMSGSTTGTIRMTASDGGNEDSTQLYLYARKNGEIKAADFDYKASSSRSSLALGTDADGDALHENQLTATATFTDGSTMDITSDTDDDGIANSEVFMKTKGSTGGIRLGGMSGSTTGTIRMAASPDSTYEDHSSVDALGNSGTRRGMNSNVRSTALLGVDRGLRQTSNEQTCDSAIARGVLSGMSGSTTGTIRMMAGADSTVDYQDMDSDDDGLPESSSKTKTTSSSSSSVFTHMSGSTTGTIRMMASSDSTIDCMDMDSDDDGISDASTEQHLDDQGARAAYMGRSGSTTGTIRMMASSDSTRNYLDMDDDGDAVPERSQEMTIAPTTNRLAIKTKGTSAHRTTQSMDSWGDSTRNLNSLDVDNDGDADTYMECTVDPSSARSAWKGGMSGSTTGTIRMAASDGSGGGGGGSSISEIILEADVDGDGVEDRSVTADCDDTDARIRVTNIGSSGQDGVSIEANAASRRVRLGNLGSSGQDGIDMEVLSTMRRLSVSNIGSSGQDGVSIEVDGSSKRLTVGNIGSSGQDGVSIDLDGTSRRLTVGNIGSSGQDGVSMEVGAAKSRLTVHNLGSSGQDGVSFEATSTGAHMGLDTIPGSAKIAVGGGAYCDGTTWVNASDVNSKENFESVDGAQVLDRLADLKITRWNYKSQPGVEHIGPTAQDFQKAFGVGANDKSISTIDPSGIALAAIKELQKQNADLRGENADLREALQALSRKVDALVATQ